MPRVDIFDTLCVEGVVIAVWSRPVDTLFVSRADIEVVGILRRSVQHCTISLHQVGREGGRGRREREGGGRVLLIIIYFS